jgi:hypothetical protein
MSNGFIYVVDAHFVDKIEKKKKILDPSACDIVLPRFQFRSNHAAPCATLHYFKSEVYAVFRWFSWKNYCPWCFNSFIAAITV